MELGITHFIQEVECCIAGTHFLFRCNSRCNIVGGLEQERSDKWGRKTVMSVEQTREATSTPRSPDEGWFVRLARLQELLTACPSDILSRCELAALLETMEMYEEALVNWKVVIDRDANHLKAREGVVRCRRKTGRHLQPAC
jgi:hypothetical protein